MKARKWILAKHFEGVPKDSDLELVEEELPSLTDGDVLFEALYWSVDPYMRPYSRNLSVGSVMYGEQLARVVESKNKNYAVGANYLVRAGWRDRLVINPDKQTTLFGSSVQSAIDTGSHPASLNIGVLGMPGMSAYIGLLKICEPKPGETVYVNSAAGIVGSVVGQIAKIKGCKVIGSAGTDEKCKWLTSELGFDYAFNYKTRDLNEALK
jgi:prostaglandin reductase 1